MTAEFNGVSVPAKSTHRATVIWMHGLGDSGDGFAPIVPALNLPDELGIKFLFPHAPVRPVTVNGGMEMRAWYDIYSMSLERKIDVAGVEASCQYIRQLIDDEIANGIDPLQIVLAGFSQGGLIALHLFPRLPFALAGTMALSTYLSDTDALKQEHRPESLATPILLHHGTHDDVVPPVLGERSNSTLRALNYSVQYQTYRMAHSVCPEQLTDIRQWLISVLNPSGDGANIKTDSGAVT